jgi:hypothetical protein
MIFEYSNSWNSPRFWFSPNIGDIVSTLSYSHGLALVEYSQELSITRSIGSFLVSGAFNDVRVFGERLEKDYSKYLTLSHTDWDHYQRSIN